MIPNLLVLAASALIPFLFAMAWFHPALFGGDNWIKITGMDPAIGKTPVKPLKIALSVVLNFFIAFGIFNLSVHQFHVFSLVGANTELLQTGTAAALLAEYGSNFLNFGHGMVHGFFATLVFVLPVLGYVVIFEKKEWQIFLGLSFLLDDMSDANGWCDLPVGSAGCVVGINVNLPYRHIGFA